MEINEAHYAFWLFFIIDPLLIRKTSKFLIRTSSKEGYLPLLGLSVNVLTDVYLGKKECTRNTFIPKTSTKVPKAHGKN